MTESDIIFLSNVQKVSMADDWYDIASKDHFWIAWRFAFLKKMLKNVIHPGSKVMEVGCGNSLFRMALECEHDIAVDGCDLNLFALKKGEKGKGEIYIYDVYEKASSLKEKYDVIFLLDVIEHIEDDVSFIKACNHLLKPGGHLVINVPYSKLLFSNYDHAAGHLRRYSKKELKNTVNESGLQVTSVETWGFLLLPISILRKILLSFYSDKTRIIETGFKPPSAFVHKILHLMRWLELSLPVKYPFGTSVACVAVKARNVS